MIHKVVNDSATVSNSCVLVFGSTNDRHCMEVEDEGVDLALLAKCMSLLPKPTQGYLQGMCVVRVVHGQQRVIAELSFSFTRLYFRLHPYLISKEDEFTEYEK